IAPFLSEFVQKQHRGRFIGSLSGFFSFGFVFAALLGYFVIRASSDGWRIVQVISALPIVMLLWWRRSLPESPRWLIERGRSAEAEAEVERIEAEVMRRRHESLPPVESIEIPVVAVHKGGTFAKNLVSPPSAENAIPVVALRKGGTFTRNLAALWSPSMRRTTVMLWILWIAITFSYYGF